MQLGKGLLDGPINGGLVSKGAYIKNKRPVSKLVIETGFLFTVLVFN